MFGFVFEEDHAAERAKGAGEESQCEQYEFRHPPLGEDGTVFVPAINCESQDAHDVYDEKIIHKCKRLFNDKDMITIQILSTKTVVRVIGRQS